jgi:hypothetical protein
MERNEGDAKRVLDLYQRIKRIDEFLAEAQLVGVGMVALAGCEEVRFPEAARQRITNLIAAELSIERAQIALALEDLGFGTPGALTVKAHVIPDVAKEAA